jgi:hypothetical protein
MRSFVSIAAALAMVTPSVAFAEPAVQALSLSNAAAQPLRASAKTSKKLKIDGNNTALIILGIFGTAGAICAVACGSNSPKSP